MTRRLLASAVTGAAIFAVVPTAPASAQICQLVRDCLCRVNVACGPITGCYDTGEIKFCL